MEEMFVNLYEMFWENVTFEAFLKFVIVYFIVVWISLIVWVIKDIVNRTDSVLLQILAILIVTLLSPFGIFIYLLIRPSKTVFEKYYEEIEDNLETLTTIVKKSLGTDDEKKTVAKKRAPKKAPVKKTTAAKSPSKKAPAKKTTSTKTVAKKAPVKKTTTPAKRGPGRPKKIEK